MAEIIIDPETLKLLAEMHFEPEKEQPKLFQFKGKKGKDTCPEDIEAFVDFREKDGYRFGKRGSTFLKDANLIPILNSFKLKRDEIKKKLLEGLGDKAIVEGENKEKEIVGNELRGIPKSSSPDDKAQLPKPPEASHSKSVFFDEIVLAYEIDICELFGGAGDGKSKIAKKIAEEAIERGKKVLYVDTERGFLKRDLQKLGSSYRYISNLKGVMDLVKNIPNDIDVFILDSVGYPVLTEWAKMGVNERGNALTQIIAIKDLIKDWAISNGKIALVINQPDSDFGKEQGYVNRPFGDKGQFIIKEVFLIKRVLSNTIMTKSVIESFRSRHDARGIRIAEVEITNEGVKII